MTARSILRALSHLAADIPHALRRAVAPPYDDDPDAYAEHIAKLHTEAGQKARRDFADKLAEREAASDGLCARDECVCPADGADERLADCGLGPITDLNVDSLTGAILPTRLIAPLTADETILVRQLLAERFPESSAAPPPSLDGATEPPAADPHPPAAGGIPLSPAEAHKQALTQALAQDRKRLRCNTYKPLHPDRCTKLAGHEGQHSYNGIFWDIDPSK
jgi:hypothetical protein